MSFAFWKESVEHGDTAILYLSIHSMHAIVVEPKIKSKTGQLVENVFQTSYGALKVKDLIGKKYGSVVQLTKGWGYLLHPTPELWTLTLPHRTQILYTPDISLIIMLLDLRPGSVVGEAGTGSGSLSHAILRTISPSGHLHTFDFHEQRVATATQEFLQHGLSSNVTVKQRDVAAEGFGLTDTADAVFLDLPHPWEVIKHVVTALRKEGGRVCSFSPCIEQVQRTCEALRRHRFTEISTVECLQREFQVRNISLPVLSLKQPTNDLDVLNNQKKQHTENELPSSERKDSEKMESNRETGERSGRRAEENEREKGEENSEKDTEINSETRCHQEKRKERGDELGERQSRKKRKKAAPKPEVERFETFRTGVPLLQMPGHTGYLTFATLPPRAVPCPIPQSQTDKVITKT